MMIDDEKAIRDLVAKWMEASKNKDINTLLSLMTDDVVFMVPDSEPFGKARFEDVSRGMSDAKIHGHADIKEIRILGDWAYYRTHLDIRITPAGGHEMHKSGYAMTIVHKDVDGQWRLARDANIVTDKMA